MSNRVTLPWPAHVLNPNARVGRHEHSIATARARRMGKAEALLAGLNLIELPPGQCPLVLVFHFPDDHIRDSDNLLSACKAYRDGITEVLGVNDSLFWPVLVARGKNVKGGSVDIDFGLVPLVRALVVQFGIELMGRALQQAVDDGEKQT